MPDEMGSVSEELRNVVGIALEVDAAVRGTLSKPAAIHEQQTVRVGERSLFLPRRLAPAEASVHEHGRLAFSPDCDVQPDRVSHAASLPPGSPSREGPKPRIGP